ncbi:MAG: response regulator [Lachnospiraceae bacterium]|nr:response regulator [Lachnospiraceae bacterium]
MEFDNQKIGLIVFHNSIIIRGVEKKLSGMGYNVTLVLDGFDRIPFLAKQMNLFIIYLPEDADGDVRIKKQLESICSSIKENNGKVLIIGESRYHSDMSAEIPEIAGIPWMNRPIDMDKLCETAEEIMSATETVNEVRRILIVDDDPSYARMVREWLKDKYQANVVTSGMQAVTFLSKNKVDLILLDYEMPVLDGPQVFQMLRSEEETKDIPVIFLTGVGTREGVSRVMELRPNGYVLKSTTREDLIAYLKNHL